MRSSLVAAAVLALACPRAASADQLPPGSLGILTGVVAGTGADAKRLGVGWYPFWTGGQASWQPTSTDRPYGYTIRWSTMLGQLYDASAAQIDDTLSTVQMDLTVGLRYRPWSTPRRYLTARVGAELFRANEPIPVSDEPGAEMRRAFVGGIASVGLDQYVYSFMLSVDVRYGMIGGDGPSQLALIVGFGVTGP